MIMNKMVGIIGIIIVFMLVAAGMTGLVPFSISGLNTNTDNKEYGGIHGTGELMGPNSRKGYIISYMHDGLSETVVCQGKVTADTWAWGQTNGFYYKISAKKNTWSDWEVLSKPGETSRYISTQNPGVIEVTGINIGGTYVVEEDYSFEIVGNEYAAVRTELYMSCKNAANPFDPFKWRLIQRDEAYLYEGWGGLYLPKDSDGRPRSTFEIGETVSIDVETTYGGQTVGDEGKTWRVALIEPSDQGGSEVKHQDYGDNARSTFSFTVTDDMFSTQSTNRYRVEIYNTLLPKGTLNVNTIDILAKAPSDVSFSNAPTQSKVGNEVSMTLSALVNSQTQLPVSSFEVSVIYGTNDVLLPSNPSHSRWIIPTTDISASNNQAVLTFTPEKESYVTVHAKAYDAEGRSSVHTKTWTLFAYAGSPPPEDQTDPETGEDDYGGGHYEGWLPWDPSGIWESIFNDTIVYALLAVIVALVFVLIAVFVPVPIQFKIVIVALGVVLAIILFYFLNNGF
jgi:hypothetical protein